MKRSILTKEQRAFLKSLSKEKAFFKDFYFTGGTCLSEFYLQHRVSEDLDFFSKKEINHIQTTALIKKTKADVGYKAFDFQQSFNRNIYQLIFEKRTFLKVEFTYYPFPILKNISSNTSSLL